MNDIKIPFNLYDFLGYIVHGFLLLIGLIFLFDIAKDTIDGLISSYGLYPSGFMLLLISYILGHINSDFGKLVIEDFYVKKMKGYPKVLETNKPFREEFNRVFDKYFENKFEDKDNKFLLAFHTVKENCPVAFSRIFSFLVSYGFARNLCMVFNVYALLFLIKFIYHINSWYFVGFLISIAFSYGFFRRYYKFLNHHNLEVYYSFYLYAKNK
ncbi:MAG: hypothetical protein KAT65_00335 [Methanophagales archaeon]|nr:hypothetical protein [Methanophagales archaeon]